MDVLMINIFLPFCFITWSISSGANTVSPLPGCLNNDQQLKDVLSSLFQNPSMRNLENLSGAARAKTLLTAMAQDEKLKGAIFTEPNKYGNNFHSSDLEFPKFNCKPFHRKCHPPKTVQELTAADIDAVGAIGDSLTAGMAIDAATVLQIYSDNRGRSFSIGGDADVSTNPTLFNILKLYNPNIIGASLGSAFNSSHLNVAISGATSSLLLYQAQLLVKQMRKELDVEGRDFKSSWKLVTIFIGHNDACSYCLHNTSNQHTAEILKSKLVSTLDYLKKHMPRTLVNVITILNVALIQQLNIGSVCKTMHYFQCQCAAYSCLSSKELNLIAKTYQNEVMKLHYHETIHNTPEFAVTVQPFLLDTLLPMKVNGQVDLSYFAPDCFHWSAKGHATMAMALWHSMHQAFKDKPRSWKFDTKEYYCPSADNTFLTD